MTDVREYKAYAEVVVSTVPVVQFVQAWATYGEAVAVGNPAIAVYGAYAEIVLLYREPPVTDIYPTLPGIAWSVIRRPKFSTGTSVSTSGREVRIGYYSAPLWEWDLKYTYLPDFQGAGATASDYRTLLGFFASHFGALHGFYFEDPDDNTVVGQTTGVGDGNERTFRLARTYGLTPYETTEFIGGLDTASDVNIYLDGVLQALTTDYTLSTTVPGQQSVVFNTPPAVDVVVTVDMHYYFFVRFKEDSLDFDQFMKNFWENEKVELVSLRG